MPRTKISEFSATPANNTDIDSINIAEGCAPSGINDAIRELMAQLKDFQTGAVGDSFNGPIGTSTAAAGAFTTLTTSSTVTHNGGTANGVTYLNGSKVLTSGSALTFNGTSLGVGSSSYGDAGTISLSVGVAGTTSGGLQLWASSAQEHYIQWGDSTTGSATYAGAISYSHASDFMRFWTASTEGMRLTSTGLGIGTTSPAAKLDVLGSFFNGGSSRTNSTTKTFGFRVPHFLTATDPMNIIGGLSTTSVNNVYIGGSDSNIGGTAATDLFFYTAANNTTANGTLRMTITSAGDVGIGTSSPDVFANGFAKNLGVAVTGSGATASINVSGGSGGAGRIQFGTEANRYGLIYVDASNFMQIGTTTSLPISFITNNTERARIDASGNLLVGTTSGSGNRLDVVGGGIQVTASGTSFNLLNIKDSVDQSGATYVQFYNSAGGNIGNINRVGTTNAVVYNTTSDYRLKTVTGLVTGQGARIDALKPVDYLWTDGGQQARGFLAHEFQTVYPNSVSGDKDAVDADGNPKYQGMQAGTAEVIADLVAEIQSLRQRLSAANL